jgi:ABC-2 type transport system ATP-binding protein
VLQLFGSFYQKSVKPDDLIAMVDLGEKRSTHNKSLSGGQQQRLSVALAMVNDPNVIFLDEPTTGLDPQARRSLWDVIKKLQSQGKTIFLTTHYMEEAERLCDRVAIVDHGKVIATNTPNDLINDYFRESVIEFGRNGHLPEQSLRALPGVQNVVFGDDATTLYTVSVAQSISGLLELANGHSDELKNLFVRHASLEDVFLKLTGRRIRE